jgi:hypothetical protein
MMMTPKTAREILGMVNGYTVDEVQQHFNAYVKAHHPDTGGDGVGLGDAKEARDVLISALGGEIGCTQCLGRGRVRGRLGSVECANCHGEGQAH